MPVATALRVLVVEDEGLIALYLAEQIEQAGAVCIGPVPTVRQALRLLDADAVDAAFLDLNLGHEKSIPVAEAMERRGLPFVFATGHLSDLIPQHLRHHRRLDKPFDRGAIRQAIADFRAARDPPVAAPDAAVG